MYQARMSRTSEALLQYFGMKLLQYFGFKTPLFSIDLNFNAQTVTLFSLLQAWAELEKTEHEREVALRDELIRYVRADA